MISMFFIQRCKDNDISLMYTYMRTLISKNMAQWEQPYCAITL